MPGLLPEGRGCAPPAGPGKTETDPENPAAYGGDVVRYEILGQVRVVEGDSVSYISARKIETLLVALLIRADQVIAAEHLILEIWAARAPRRAPAGLHVYISDLRKFLSRGER